MNSAAVAQIEQLSSADGAIQYQGAYERDGFTFLRVSLDTRGITHARGGIRVRAREVFHIAVGDDFPFSPPSVLATHTRWAATPHVQWGSSICIYAAPSVEWSPGDGMRGLIDRLMLWLERAALGTLDPEGQPLHPPVAYPTRSAGNILIRPDLGARVPWDRDEPASVLFAWCAQDGDRVDVIEWMTFGEIATRVLGEGFQPADEHGRPTFIATTVLISDQIGFEYPKKANALIAALEKSGVGKEKFLGEISRARLVNSFLEGKLTDVFLPEHHSARHSFKATGQGPSCSPQRLAARRARGQARRLALQVGHRPARSKSGTDLLTRRGLDRHRRNCMDAGLGRSTRGHEAPRRRHRH